MLDRPMTVSTAVKLCSKTEFPNVHVLLRIACTIPVTSCAVRKNRQQLASATHVHTSINGSGSPQQFAIDSRLL